MENVSQFLREGGRLAISFDNNMGAFVVTAKKHKFDPFLFAIDCSADSSQFVESLDYWMDFLNRLETP